MQAKQNVERVLGVMLGAHLTARQQIGTLLAALPSPSHISNENNFNTGSLKKGTAMTPEEEAREEIDNLLEAAGWQVQDYKNLNLGAALGVAGKGSSYPPRAMIVKQLLSNIMKQIPLYGTNVI